MPAWDHLVAYIDPAVPPLAAGSAELRLNWSSLLGAGAVVLAGAGPVGGAAVPALTAVRRPALGGQL